jgi:hypothetical protein
VKDSRRPTVARRRQCWLHVVSAIAAALLPAAVVLARAPFTILSLVFMLSPVAFVASVIYVHRLSHGSWHTWWLLLLAPVCLWWPLQVLAMLLSWALQGGFVGLREDAAAPYRSAAVFREFQRLPGRQPAAEERGEV